MSNENLKLLEQKRKDAAEQAELEKKMFNIDKIAEMSGYQKEMISVMHRTVAKGTTPVELLYFLQYCKTSGLNPLNKEIWCYKDTQGNLIMFTGRDGFLKKNKENPLYRGMRSSEVCENDDFEIDMIEGKISHKFKAKERGKVLGAYAIVSIEGNKDTVKWLDIDEFDLGQAKWKTSKKMMIKKCAESHALKEACGMTGIQSEESWNIKNGVATSVVEKTEDINHEEMRLLDMIEAAKSQEALEKLKSHCETPEQVLAYDNKLKTFKVE